MASQLQKAFEALRAHANTFPETHEDHPWGELAVKVKGKAFLFMRQEGDVLSLSTKLPSSRDMAADLPFASPTGYGLGKSGWVTSKFEGRATKPPIDLLKSWIDESYRAVAPKKVVKALDT
jgi:hypothetical protein